MRVLLVYPNLMMQTQLPVNISLLSSYLKHNDHRVKLFDTTFYHTENKSVDERRVERLQVKPTNPESVGVVFKKTSVYDDFKDMIKSFKPDLIAITLLDDTLTLAYSLLEYTFDVPVVAGGISCILSPERILGNMDVDYVCTGEGEQTIVKLCNHLERGEGLLKDVPNLAYREHDKIIYTGMCPLLDLDDLLYEDYSIFDDKRFYRPMIDKMVKSIPINLDRGCPYVCSFCCASAIKDKYIERYYRVKTVDRIRDELEYQIGLYDPDFIYFNSESFFVRTVSMLKKLGEMYKEFDLPFWCQGNVGCLSDEKLRIVKQMGVATISMGVECGNEFYRRNMLNKYFSNDCLLSEVDLFEKHNIPVSFNNIIGLPDETRDLIFETIHLNQLIHRRHGMSGFNGFIFQPYRNTKLWSYCKQMGYISDDTQTDTLLGGPVVYNPFVSDEELLGLLRTFVMYIKMPYHLLPSVFQAEKDDIVFEQMKEKYYELYG